MPKYCRHKATGQAYATINGKVVYFGTYDSPESREAYDCTIAKYRELHATPAHTTTIGQLCVQFIREHATHYYLPSEVANFQNAMRTLIKLFRTTRVGEFGPRKLKAVRDALTEKHVRIQVNNHLACLKRVFEGGGVSRNCPALDLSRFEVGEELETRTLQGQGRKASAARP